MIVISFYHPMKKSGLSLVCNPPHDVFGTTCKYQRNCDFNPDFRSIFRPCINITFLLNERIYTFFM